MTDIGLNRAAWKFDETKQIGPVGGFGTVFYGESEDGNVVAVKRLHVTVGDAAYRELRVAEELVDKSFQHVIPVLDEGQDANSDRYFIVMTMAESSLQEHLDSVEALDESETVEILLQIAMGLNEVAKLVHRDLKPGNILYHEGVWKIADFGIARFVADSTSVNTLKDCLSPYYAAPEQWRLERASNATDIYALGCIAHACINGTPPFNGDYDELRECHLNKQVPTLTSDDPRLNALTSTMLRKVPASRPSLSRVIDQLRFIQEDPVVVTTVSSPWNLLATASEKVAQAEALAETERERELLEKQQRREIYNQAINILTDITNNLFRRISNVAPTANRISQHELYLGIGEIEVSELRQNPIGPEHFHSSGWDVVCGAVIAVSQHSPNYIWSSSLWYAKQHPTDEYRWREVSYFGSPFITKRHNFEPHFLDDLYEADIAIGRRVMGAYQVAWGPEPIDDENSESFFERWVERLADAAQGRLSHPTRLPLR